MMHQTKKTVGLICGGQGTEHEVDLFSVKEVEGSLDPNKYNILLIGIDTEGFWHFAESSDALVTFQGEHAFLKLETPKVFPMLGGKLYDPVKQEVLAKMDLFFSVADDPIQAQLHSLGVPYVGSDIYGTVIGRDKDVTKRLLRDHGFPIIPYRVFHPNDSIEYETIERELGMPVFVKPCRLGSSYGVSRATNDAEFYNAIELAFQYDRKIMVEQAVVGREIECGVLGNQNPIASDVLGEVMNLKTFFTFEAKYLDTDEGELKVPADIEPAIVQEMREAAVAAFRLAECEGIARVDFFLKPDNTFHILEINTSPGLAKRLMLSLVWKASGFSHSQLMDRMIELAIERHAQDRRDG